MPYPIIVVTLDGFTPAALSCYGSSWNRTPVIDRIAANGMVWDRCLTSSDDPVSNFRDLAEHLLKSVGTAGRGSIELVTDSSAIADAARGRDFQQIDFVASDPVNGHGDSSIDIAETQLGRLIATALDRHAHNPDWGLMWLHSQYLTHCWDAPRAGWAIDAEIDESENLSTAGPESEAGANREMSSDEHLPSVFADHLPPSIELTGQEHPDLVIAWMRTYACQIQLLDLVMETIASIASDRQARIVLAGTSGFRLGQGGAIGHRPRQIRSRDIHVPMIYSAGGPIRYPRLNGYRQAVAKIADRSTHETMDAIRPSDKSTTIVIESQRSSRAMTTDEWFMVIDADGTNHLYSKPDDIEDFNDVARVRPDVMAMLESALENPADQ